MAKERSRRYIIVSNRLPLSFIKDNEGIKSREGAGGLVSGMKSYLNAIGYENYVWIGWPGSTFESEEDRKEVTSQAEKLKSVPVFLDEATYNGFYNGFCNSTVYPLFHYFTNYVKYDNGNWETYKKVNEIFRDAILKIAKPGDMVWIHDYHLMLLPALLRASGIDADIGFFLHIPFPSYEIFRLLPGEWGKGLLNGMLGADLIGFHTYDYMQDFLTCVSRLLGYESNIGYLEGQDGRIKRVDTFPMGIDFGKFQKLARNPDVIAEKKKLSAFGSQKIIFSIDRLDYTKGILNRLEGYRIFLEQNPDKRGNVVLVLVVVPSRGDIKEYQRMKVAIDEKVGSINGRFGTIDWTPITYQYRFIDANMLIALYASASIALITPLRDGMNLVAKEYVACKVDSPGILILSDMTGAAKELGDAIIVNPYHPQDICAALEKAFTMPVEEQMHRVGLMQDRIRSYDIVRWGNDFIKELEDLKDMQDVFNAKLLGKNEGPLLSDYKKAKKSLILLDYDGVLTPLVEDPKKAVPTKHVVDLLRMLSKRENTEVVVISGRGKDMLDKWFGDLDISLVAEHGALVKDRGSGWRFLRPLTSGWKEVIMPMLKDYADRLPGSHIEEKEFSLVWHYRKAESEFASLRIKELFDNLSKFTSNADVQIYKGNKIIEIKNAGSGKGLAATYFVNKISPDFILAMGDDYTDEDMFRLLPKEAYTIRIGMVQSYARYNLHDSADAVRLLGKMAQ